MRKRIMRLVINTVLPFIVMSLFPLFNTQAASYDCDKAMTKVEKMICADPELSEMDEELNEAYLQALKETDEDDYLKQQQREWLATVRNRCVDAGQLEEQYQLQTMLFYNLGWLKNTPVAQIDCNHKESSFALYYCKDIIPTYQGNENQYSYNKEINGLSGDLTLLDAELQRLYAEVAKMHFDSKLFHREQLSWQRLRERCVQDDNCRDPSLLYLDRIAQLRYDLEHPPTTDDERKKARIVSMGSPAGTNFKFDIDPSSNDRGTGFCEALVRWFNYTTPNGDLPCIYHLVTNMPGVSVPHWQQLNVKEHKELLTDFLLQGLEGFPENVKKERLPVELEQSLARGDRLWIVETDFSSYDKPPKMATIVFYERRDASSSIVEPLSTCPQYDPNGKFAAVASDLKHIDREKTRDLGKPGYRYMLLYQGRPFFLTSSHAFIATKTFKLITTCLINNHFPK